VSTGRGQGNIVGVARHIGGLFQLDVKLLDLKQLDVKWLDPKVAGKMHRASG